MAHTIARDARGSQGQLGYKVETAYGTAVVVDTFLPVVLPVGLKPTVAMLESQARVPGRISAQTSQNVAYDGGGDGAITFELTRSDLLKWLRWAIGDEPTSAAQGGTAAYLHTFEKNLAAAAMSIAGTSMTLQTGVPMSGGGVEPFTFAGCMCPSWEVNADADSIAQIVFNVDANSAVHTTDLATPTYPATHVPFSWRSAAVVKRAGTTLPGVRSAKFSCENSITGAERHLFDGTGKRAQPKFNSNVVAQLELEIEPSALATTYDDWTTNTGRAWVYEFVGALAAVGYYYTFRITIADGYIQGEAPDLSSEELLTHSLTILANDNGTDPTFKVEVISLETAI